MAGTGATDLDTQAQNYGQDFGRHRANSERTERSASYRNGTLNKGNQTRGNSQQ
ncbi:hypothetical protein [Actinomadura sp. NBRC 104412]|uniref:hypothetical protein n=1 Tax=Actinomadura sp. NBRC 104412 TaxID=3032203 RepID=UPI002557568C|nr:hypothetical protein [Actinomadura sp. NBRC 104412]